MKLSQQIAENIVHEVNAVIPQMINIMDENGVIIASSDLSRVGTLHDGAVQILRDGLDELIIHSPDEFFGSKPGVNYPIIMQGAYVGVLGITGDYTDVADSALIIKRMTELFPGLDDIAHALADEPEVTVVPNGVLTVQARDANVDLEGFLV